MYLLYLPLTTHFFSVHKNPLLNKAKKMKNDILIYIYSLFLFPLKGTPVQKNFILTREQ